VGEKARAIKYNELTKMNIVKSTHDVSQETCPSHINNTPDGIRTWPECFDKRTAKVKVGK
jgi:hypothetical protein